MCYFRALALLLAISFVFSGQALLLKRTGGHDVGADSHPEIEETSLQEVAVEQDEQELQGMDGFISSSEDNAGEEQEHDEQEVGEPSFMQDSVRIQSKTNVTSRPKDKIYMPDVDCEVWGLVAPAGKACSDVCGEPDANQALSTYAFSGYRIGSRISKFNSNREYLPPKEFLKSQTDFFAAVTTCSKTRKCYEGSDGFNRCAWAPFVYRTKGSKKYTCVTNDKNKLAKYSVKPKIKSHRRLCACMDCASGS